MLAQLKEIYVPSNMIFLRYFTLDPLVVLCLDVAAWLVSP